MSGDIMACSETEVLGVIVRYQCVRNVLAQLEALIRNAGGEFHLTDNSIINQLPITSPQAEFSVCLPTGLPNLGPVDDSLRVA